jgi:RNA polymerase sigma factor (sigma-70 family)
LAIVGLPWLVAGAPAGHGGGRENDNEMTATAAAALAVAPAEPDLLRRARAGDPLAFEEVLLPLQRPAYRLAYTLLGGDAHAAEDALQEAYLKAWRKFHQFRYGTSPHSWFLTIVANECRSMTRTRWWSVVRQAEVVERSVPDLAGGSGARLALEAALARLPFEHRLVVSLYYGQDLSQQTVAAILGVRPGTVKSRIHRAVARLRRELAAIDPDVIPRPRARGGRRR